MKKILYIHGYKGSTNGPSFDLLKRHLPKGYALESIDYDYRDPKKAVYSIDRYVREYGIDYVIGSSLGGFLAMMLMNCPRIAFNPCFVPSVELPKIDSEFPAEVVARYVELESSLYNVQDIDSQMGIQFVLGDDDELLGDRYYDAIAKYWSRSNGICTCHSHHHISKDAARVIMQEALPILEKRVMQYGEMAL